MNASLWTGVRPVSMPSCTVQATTQPVLPVSQCVGLKSASCLRADLCMPSCAAVAAAPDMSEQEVHDAVTTWQLATLVADLGIPTEAVSYSCAHHQNSICRTTTALHVHVSMQPFCVQRRRSLPS
jgi:hypothetical protein